MNIDTTQKHLNELKNLVEANQNEGTLKILQAKDNVLRKLDDQDRFYSESIENMNDQIIDIGRIARDSVGEKITELETKMTVLADNLRSTFEENLEDMVIERKQTEGKIVTQFKDIKLVCSAYFEQYNTKMEAVELEQGVLLDKLKAWSKVLIEPATFNDARLFAVETRMENEEEIRMKEFDFIRDQLRKIVFSLEQELIQDPTLSKEIQVEPAEYFNTKNPNSMRTSQT